MSITINKYFCSFYNQREEEKIKMISSNVQSRHSLDVFYRMKFGNEFVTSKLLVGSPPKRICLRHDRLRGVP